MMKNLPEILVERINVFIHGIFGEDKKFACDPVGEGINNINFKVSLDDKDYLLRLEGNNTSVLGIIRQNELKILDQTYQLGISPKLLHYDLENGLYLSEFINGKPLSPDLIKSQNHSEEIAQILLKLHQSDAIPGKFSGLSIVNKYHETAVEKGLQPNDIALETLKVCQLIGMLLVEERPCVPCHNDLIATNFIYDCKKIWLIDWEYGGMGDPFFDLANFTVNQQMNQKEVEQFLGYYNKDMTRADYAQVMIMRVVTDLREAWWAYLQSTMSELKYNYVEYADKHAQRALLISRTNDFHTWIQDLGTAK